MQFHLDGFRPGDPEIAPSAGSNVWQPSDDISGDVDVLIVGCGPAGLTLAAQLSQFPDIRTRIVEQKPGPLQLGQADGIACRTMEMFNAFGFVEQVMREAYWVNETVFWKPDPAAPGNIMRTGRVQDVEDGLSEFPHVILNQARVHDFFLDVMRNSPTRLEPDYQRRVVDLKIDPNSGDHPVTVGIERAGGAEEGREETVRARYVVGCDGARSSVRRALGHALHGDSANQAWGVMDILAVTDFPDVRLKCLIQSSGDGSIVLIPREGGYLIRVYVELDKLAADERVANREITVEQIIDGARSILHPYSLDVKEVAWWSVYEIGQRLCDRFDDVPEAERETRLPRVFIAGDACHTHSPKAGQGMNVSMQDTFNLGWKLAAVLRGVSPPELLHTYSAERQAIARELIDFDREWANIVSTPVSSPEDEAEVQRYFVRHGRYTAGTATVYKPSAITGQAAHQNLAAGFVIGTRFHSGPVIRFADAKPVHLGHVMKADGRWRLLIFADRGSSGGISPSVVSLCEFLGSEPGSPVGRFTRQNADIDSVIDVRAVFQQGHRELSVDEIPALLRPHKGRLGLQDYEKVFCPDLKSSNDIFDMRGVDRENGCIVLVRPDQHVAHILPLDAHAGLAAFFDAFMLPVD
ncbi:MAG: FAD-binding monooxygenase [Rhizobiaceae bacterium]